MSDPRAETSTPPRRRTRKPAEIAETPESSAEANAGAETPKPKTDNGRADSKASASERAEEMVDHAGERIGRLMAGWSGDLRRSLARAKEEAEDIWAEARDKQQHRK